MGVAPHVTRRQLPNIVPAQYIGTRNDTKEAWDPITGDKISEDRCFDPLFKAEAGGNQRTGPNPFTFPEMIMWKNASSNDINRIMAGAYGQAFNIIRDEGGEMHRIPEGYAMSGGSPLESLVKQDTQTKTSSTGAYNAIYTAVGTAQILLQQNTYGAMPKEGYLQAGYRARSVAAITSGVGIAEGSTVGDATAPTYVEIAVGLKEHEHSVALSHQMELIAGHDDVIIFSGYAQDAMDDFMTSLDTDLLQDFDTTANLNIESIDRLTATTALRIAVGYTDGDEDFHGVDRSSNSFFDAYANHDSNNNRTLEKSLIDALHTNNMSFWTKQNRGYNPASKFYITGPDTWTAWSDIEGSKQRLTGTPSWSAMPGGLQQMPGQAGGFALDEYLSMPIILDDNVTDDGGHRVYEIDGDVSKICMAQPVTVASSDHQIYVGHYHKMNIYAVMELRCERPKGNGQLRDLTP